jgi:ribosomal protein S6
MPAAEAAQSYELAFHVLPTVAEGEVANVFNKLKDVITKHGGIFTIEEVPARFDLAYEVSKYLEGRNRKFTSAYFGWVRFQVDPAEIQAITEAVEGTKEILRHLLIRLTKAEEAHPFFFHEVIASQKRSQVIDIDAEEVEKGVELEEVEEVAVVEESKDKV